MATRRGISIRGCFKCANIWSCRLVPARGHIPYAASLLRGNAALWWREVCEANRRPTMWEDFCRALREQFRPKDYGRRGRDDLATMRQYVRESVADFVFRFRATCLKVPDLSEAEKLDRFVRALVQDIGYRWNSEAQQIFTRWRCLLNAPTQ